MAASFRLFKRVFINFARRCEDSRACASAATSESGYPNRTFAIFSGLFVSIPDIAFSCLAFCGDDPVTRL